MACGDRSVTGAWFEMEESLQSVCEPASFVIEVEPDPRTLHSVDKATHPDHPVSSSWAVCLFVPLPFGRMGTMGWCESSHIMCSDNQATNWNTPSQRLAACQSPSGPFHPEAVLSIQMFFVLYSGETLQKAIYETGKKKDNYCCFSIDLETTAKAVIRKKK